MATVTVFRAPASCAPTALTATADGTVWAACGGATARLAKVSRSGKFTLFRASGSNIADLTATRGRNARLWYSTTVGTIGTMRPDGSGRKLYTVPGKGQILGITAGPDGNVWFSASTQNKMGRITPAGVVKLFPTGVKGQPGAIVSGPDGALWALVSNFQDTRLLRITKAGAVTDNSLVVPWSFDLAFRSGTLYVSGGSDRVLRVATATAIVQTFAAPAGVNVMNLAIDSGGRIWFSDHQNLDNNPRIRYFDPSGSVGEQPIPSQHASLDLVRGAGGAIWFTVRDAGEVNRATR
jgi:virginiamycin B lyase